MAMIPCPNGGKCGSRNHRPNSVAYRKCLEGSTRGQDKGAARNLTLPHETKRGVMDGGYQNLVKEAKRKGVYRAADSFVNRDMVIPEEFVQAYINNPTEINYMNREEWEEYILDDIKGRGDEIAAKLGLDVDDLDDSEFDTLVEAVFDSDRSDIAGAMAKNMGPRTFIHYCSPSKTGSRAALSEAMEKYDVGSDEWYDTLAKGYHRDLTDGRLSYPGRAGMGGSNGDEDRQAIVSALKEALRYNLDDIGEDDYDEMPGIDVVWTGYLSDVGPNDEDGDNEKLHVVNPYFVFSYPYDGVASNPVRLHGDYVIDLPGTQERRHGAESDILDDMSRKRGRYFNYPDGEGLSKYSAADVYRTFE